MASAIISLPLMQGVPKIILTTNIKRIYNTVTTLTMATMGTTFTLTKHHPSPLSHPTLHVNPTTFASSAVL